MARNVITSKGRQVRIEGLAELQNNVATLMSRATGKEVKKIWMQAALDLRDAARDYAPIAKEDIVHYEKGQPKRIIKPGALRAAIFAAYGERDKPNVLVGVSFRAAPHAHWIEFGNSRIPPQPYMRPALSLMRSSCVSTIAEGYRRLLIENQMPAEPSSSGGGVKPPTVTPGGIAKVRDRAKQAYQQKRTK
jgi:HK97 gp10 family phage protein